MAIKKIFDAFRNRTDAQRTYREIVFLREFNDHPNIIKLLNIHKAENNLDLYLVFEFMNTDLHHIIQKKTLLHKIHIQFIMYQLFLAVAHLHAGNVIHRDLKPSNILLDSECNCKIADFGLARSLGTEEDPLGAGDACLTEYVATRWYRAPEILFGSKTYTKGVDTWSLGCILAEMVLGKPLFPGKSTANQIEKIFLTMRFDARKAGVALGSCSALGQEQKSFDDMFSGKDSYDLMKRLLALNPESRLTAEDALKHKFVEAFRGPKNVKDDQKKLPKKPKENQHVKLDDNVQLTVKEYRTMLYALIDQIKR